MLGQREEDSLEVALEHPDVDLHGPAGADRHTGIRLDIHKCRVVLRVGRLHSDNPVDNFLLGIEEVGLGEVGPGRAGLGTANIEESFREAGG